MKQSIEVEINKPSFKKYMEGMADHGMKEVNKEFKNDKMAKGYT
jgi:hypothetical protein